MTQSSMIRRFLSRLIPRPRRIYAEVQWHRPMSASSGSTTVLLPPDTPLEKAFGVATAEIATRQAIDGDVVAITLYRRANPDFAFEPNLLNF